MDERMNGSADWYKDFGGLVEFERVYIRMIGFVSLKETSLES